MSKKFFWLSLVAVIISFAGGFLLANAFNRREMESLRVAAAQTDSKLPAETSDEATLSAAEIKNKIAEADRNPENIEFQKGLAMALYNYAAAKQDAAFLPDVARLLTRVYEKNPKDFNTIVSLGNINFDLSLEKKDNQLLLKARELYQKALEINPNSSSVQTDLGLTYFYAEPPETEKAVSEFKKSLEIKPDDEKTLEAVTRAYLAMNDAKSASEYSQKLKNLYPQNTLLGEIDTKLAELQTQTQKQ